MGSNTETVAFAAVEAVSGQPIQLAMQKLWLRGTILPVGARLIVRHVFRSAEAKPLEVIYTFALPRDGALRRFRVEGEGFSVHSELKPTAEAMKTYEEGIQRGNLATMARQYADGITSLTVGNIQPNETVAIVLELLAGVEASDEGLRFRFPFTLAPSYHSRARAVEVEPGVGEIELLADEFGDLILPRYHKDATGLHEVGFSLGVVMGEPIAGISSPSSHALQVKVGGGECSQVTLATEREVPDRDLVLDVAVKNPRAQVFCGTAKDEKWPFAVKMPSRAFGKAAAAPRRVVFMLDRSGSMQGVPMAQAKKALEACLGAVGKDDEFSIVAFDDNVESFGTGLRKGDKDGREMARRFLDSIDARGGTELAQAVKAAVKLLGHTAGDIMVITDGQVFSTERILDEARRTGTRIHSLGIGSASQDRFLALLARETGGISRFLTPRERVDTPAVDLFASVGRPLVSGIKAYIEGAASWHIAPDPVAAVFSGTPFTLFGEVDNDKAVLVLEWSKPQPGRLEVPMEDARVRLGDTLRLLQGARLITDLDAKWTGEEGEHATERREQKRIGDQLQALSEAYGLASRRMSLVAVIERPGDRPGELPKTEVVPVGMPQDVEMGAYFQGALSSPFASRSYDMHLAMAAPAAPRGKHDLGHQRVISQMVEESRLLLARASDAVRRVIDAQRGMKPRKQDLELMHDHLRESKDLTMQASEVLRNALHEHREAMARVDLRRLPPEDALLELAGELEPDGGMPGEDDFERIVRSLIALLAFLAEGNTQASGAFRDHVKRLLDFLETTEFATLSTRHREDFASVLGWIKKGKRPIWPLKEIFSWEIDEAWRQMCRLTTKP